MEISSFADYDYLNNAEFGSTAFEMIKQKYNELFFQKIFKSPYLDMKII